MPGSFSAPPPYSSSQAYEAPQAGPNEPRPWFEPTTTPNEYAAPSSPEQGHLWTRNPGLFWLAVGIAALLLIAIPISIFQVYSYLNRPTPTKTLDTFCSALVQENYPLAYEQFSPNLQLRLPRSRFIVLLAQDRVVSCTHGSADENSQSPHANLKLVHNSQGINSDMVRLKKGADNQWKIDNVVQAR
ncbi:hypothetical protein [Ktedonospora formicarum]|uniref:Uncharacterized protein n=1 Tax=Ktedonospora formicarum TaxID=2778364 RepID=A0A8J3HTR8_9CHLR|nr:hypothetical protein [Ktedonospora formicarum]GHO43559.1 hypothetical protein KSX_17220 [Ktedonospora formicarum]